MTNRTIVKQSVNYKPPVGERPLIKVWKRFKRHKTGLVGSVIILIFVLLALFATVISPHEPNYIDMSAFQQPPSMAHLFGTDTVGRDVLSRLLYASRISLFVGLVAVSLYLVIGTILGAIAGYFGGIIDTIIMRIADAVLSFPVLPLVIVLVAVAGNGIMNIVAVIAIVGWPQVARIVRGEIISLKSREFVEASRAIGENPFSIIFTQLIPNCVAPLIVASTFGIANAILLEAGLSFMGLGVQPPDASWGSMLMDAQSITILSNMPWLWLPPGLCIFLAVMSINFIGDALRDAVDPRLKK